MKKHLFVILSVILGTLLAHCQYDLIPMPRKMTVKSEELVRPKKIVKKKLSGAVNDEAYALSVSPKEIVIKTNSDRGHQWALRTLEQLVTDDGLCPQVEIEDWPEFGIRAFMYDTGRNFVEVEQLEQFIDLISRYKLNAFHWHMTDKPAWRIECRAYPELNDAKYQRIGRDAGRYYTYDDIHHIIKYARERGVMIIPEIDMPGHSDYFKATFGEGMNSPRGMQILTECLQEFFDEFSAEDMPYIHIGSDEVHIDNPDEFMAWATSTVENANRMPIVWDPGLKAGDGAIYQIWRDGMASPVAAGDGKKILDSYMGYLNFYDPISFPSRMFLHAPCSTGKGSENELGGILCLWNDVRVVDKTRIAPHNGMMGGVLAFAEKFWRGGAPQEPYRDVMRQSSDPDMQSLMEFQDRMMTHKEKFLAEELDYWQPNRPTTEWDLQLSDSLGNVVYAGKACGDVIDFGAICNLHKLNDVNEAKISRRIISYVDTVLECRVGFEAPPRSDRISDGIPLQGKWENFGKIAVNGVEVLPPVWNQPGMYKFHYHTWARPEEELPYTDEQLFWMREPVKISLKKGENMIELTTRRHFKEQRFMAAFLPVIDVNRVGVDFEKMTSK